MFNGQAAIDPSTRASRNCVGLASSGGGSSNTFNSTSVLAGYTGTVSFGQAVTVNNFELDSGAISQQDAFTGNADDLTVLANFTWTSGALNNSTTLANVNILGTGTITPANAGTIATGSTLVFTGTSSDPEATTINPGTISMSAVAAAGGGLVVGGFATLTAKTSTQGDIVGITSNQGASPYIVIKANGTFNWTGLGTAKFSIPVHNYGTLNLTGEVAGSIAALKNVEYTQYDGSQLRIQNGSTLSVDTSVDISGGVVYLFMNPALPASAQTATITAPSNAGGFIMSAGVILFSAPNMMGDTLVYGTFTVNGSVDWTGGMYKPSVDYTTAGLANVWIVNGTMTAAKADIVKPNNQRGNTPPKSSLWLVLNAVQTNNVLPGVDLDNNNNQLSIGAFAGGKGTQWKLGS